MAEGSVSVLRGLLAHRAAEKFGQRGFECGTGLLFDLLKSLFNRERFSSRFLGGQVVKNLSDTDNASQQRRAFFS